MNLRTYILTLLSTCAVMYVVIKVLPDEYSYIQNPTIYTIGYDKMIPSLALQIGKDDTHYLWVEQKKCFASKSNIDIEIKNDTIYAIAGVKAGEKILVFHVGKGCK
ncbi:MAG: hypothetical protein PHD21_01875 [Flavobacteriales bacterium]|nr:hypothetical protein [Flavobacteriales bacterium]